MTTDDFDPGPLAEVDAQPSGDRFTLKFVRLLAHPPATVWAALTEPSQLVEWSPFTADRNLATSGTATLTMTDGTEVEALPATVTVSESPTVLEYSWGDDLLRWELEPVDSGTRLTLFHTVESADWAPKAAAGWHICLAVADRFMSGQPVGRIVGDDAMNYGWEQLNDAYAAELGIESTGWPLGNPEAQP